MLRLAFRSRGALALARRRTMCAPAEAPAAGGAAAASPRVAALADDLVQLNMLEVKALTDALKDRLGIDDAALAGGGGMPMMSPAMMAAMGGGGAAEPAPEPVAEKTAFDLKLEAYDAAKKIAVIKEIRSITSLGLKEAKALVDEAPKVFKTAVAKEEAEEIAAKLKEIGATVKLE